MIKRLQRLKYGVGFDESLSDSELDALDGLSSLDDDDVRQLLAHYGDKPIDAGEPNNTNLVTKQQQQIAI